MIRNPEKPENHLAESIIGAAIEVHRYLGSGLLESAYGACLADELAARGLRFAREADVPIVYKGRTISRAFRADFVVEEQVIIELKTVVEVANVHRAQALTYLRLSDLRLCLLLNFWALRMRDGVERFVNKL